MNVEDVLLPVLATDLDRISERPKVNARCHNDLKGGQSADGVANSKHAVAEGNDGKLFDEKDGIQVRHTQSPALTTTERDGFLLTDVNNSVTGISLSARDPDAQGLETHCPCSRLQPTSPEPPGLH